MEKEIVKRIEDVKNECNYLNLRLHQKYDELYAYGSSEETLKEVKKYIEKVNTIYNLSEANISRAEERLELVSKVLNFKFNIYKDDLDVNDESNVIIRGNNNLSYDISNIKSKRNNNLLLGSINSLSTMLWLYNTLHSDRLIYIVPAISFGALSGLYFTEYAHFNSELKQVLKKDRKLNGGL